MVRYSPLGAHAFFRLYARYFSATYERWSALQKLSGETEMELHYPLKKGYDKIHHKRSSQENSVRSRRMSQVLILPSANSLKRAAQSLTREYPLHLKSLRKYREQTADRFYGSSPSDHSARPPLNRVRRTPMRIMADWLSSF